MHIHHRSIAALFIVSLLMIGCRGGGTSSPVTDADNDIHGMVTLRNGYLNIDSNRTGIIVTARSSKWEGSDTTGADGSWSIVGPPAGVYEFSARRGAFTSGVVSNIQYVGSGRYRLENGLALQEGIAADYVASASVDTLFWFYRYQYSEDTTKPPIKEDSSLVLTVKVISQSSAGFDCRIAETPNARCDEALEQTSSGPDHTGTTWILNLSGLCKKLVQRYGKALTGKHLYLQLRPPGGIQKRPDDTYGCIDPYVVDLYF